jgi:superoxide dismutase
MRPTEPPPSAPIARRRLSRRAFLAAGASAALAAGGRALPVRADTVRETGLAGEGLLAGPSGFQPRKPISLAHDSYPGFLSTGQLASCYGEYRQAFDKLDAAESALATTSRGASAAAQFERLRAEQVASANAVLLYELYFGNIAISTAAPSRSMVRNIGRHMGTMAAWREDFAACARVATAWVALMYDPYDDRWHDVPIGTDGAGTWIGANPLVVCPVTHGAWEIDYHDLSGFIAAFLAHLDWRVVAARWRAVNRE